MCGLFLIFHMRDPYQTCNLIVILGLKTIFSENGSPEILITDNARRSISEEFKQFAMEWSFVHKTSSPQYPKGNAHAE